MSINSNNQLKSLIFGTGSQDPYSFTLREQERNKKQSQTVKLINSMDLQHVILEKENEKENDRKNSFINKIDLTHLLNKKIIIPKSKLLTKPFFSSFVNTIINSHWNTELLKIRSNSKLPKPYNPNSHSNSKSIQIFKRPHIKSKKAFKTDLKLPLIQIMKPD